MSATLAPPTPDAPPVAPKRQVILEAAGRLFMAHGYGAVSMDAVAREAGVSKATLYAHFTGKDALFAEMVGGTCCLLQDEAEQATHHHELPLREALEVLGARWLRFMLSPRVLAIYRIVVAEGVRFPDLARAFHAAGPERLKSWLTAWTAEEIRRGRLRADADPALAGAQFTALLRGELFLRATLALDPMPPDEAEVIAAAAAAAETFLRAYGA
jgi:TetR/AcrR family transcriptional regulator, mexJK operon transcriptional repressor